MADGNSEYVGSKEEVGMAVAGAWMVGFGCMDLGGVLYRGVAGSDYIRVVDVGHVPTHQEEAERVPPLSGAENGGVDEAPESGQDMDAPFPGGGNVGGRHAGCGYLRRLPSDEEISSCTVLATNNILWNVYYYLLLTNVVIAHDNFSK